MFQAPKLIKQLFWTDLFCWMGVMGQMMYITDYMAKVVYQGSPDAEHGSKEDILFEQGVRMGSFGMLLHSLVGMEQPVFYYFQFLSAYRTQFELVKHCMKLYTLNNFSVYVCNVHPRSID